MTAPANRGWVTDHEYEDDGHGRPVHSRWCRCPRRQIASPAAPPPVEGETERCCAAGTVSAHCATCPWRSTPPVVSDQPEETDTVNDESAASVLYERANGLEECRVGATLQQFTADQYVQETVALLTSPAVGADVRVEWGVRYRNSGWWSCFDENHAQQMAAPYTDAVVVSRTVTTSAWQPVSDDQEIS